MITFFRGLGQETRPGLRLVVLEKTLRGLPGPVRRFARSGGVFFGPARRVGRRTAGGHGISGAQRRNGGRTRQIDRSGTNREMKEHILVLLVLAVLLAILTFPLCFEFSKSIPGFFSTDEPFSSLWDNWRIKYSFGHRLSGKNFPLLSYPFGTQDSRSGYVSYLWNFLRCLLSLLFSPPVAHNLQVFFNLLLSGFFAYLLTSRLTGSRLSGITGAIAFAGCPYQFMRAWQHLGLTYNQWLPLILPPE